MADRSRGTGLIVDGGCVGEGSHIQRKIRLGVLKVDSWLSGKMTGAASSLDTGKYL